MEVIGEYNPKSTPETRMRDRNRAAAIGTIETILTSQPFLIGYVVLGFLLAGILEGINFG